LSLEDSARPDEEYIPLADRLRRCAAKKVIVAAFGAAGDCFASAGLQGLQCKQAAQSEEQPEHAKATAAVPGATASDGDCEPFAAGRRVVAAVARMAARRAAAAKLRAEKVAAEKAYAAKIAAKIAAQRAAAKAARAEIAAKRLVAARNSAAHVQALFDLASRGV